MDARKETTQLSLTKSASGDEFHCLHVSGAHSSLNQLFTLLASHPEIIKLELSDCFLSDADINVLAQNRQLQSIAFKNCNINEGQACALAKGIPTLTFIDWDLKGIEQTSFIKNMTEQFLEKNSESIGNMFIKNILIDNMIFLLPEVAAQIKNYLTHVYYVHLDFLTNDEHPQKKINLPPDLLITALTKDSLQAFQAIQKIINNKDKVSKKDPLISIKKIAARVIAGEPFEKSFIPLFSGKAKYDKPFVELCERISQASSIKEVESLLSKASSIHLQKDTPEYKSNLKPKKK